MMWNTFPLGSKWNEARSSEFEALERGTATTHVDRTVPPKVTVSAASVDVRVNAPKNTVPWKQP